MSDFFVEMDESEITAILSEGKLHGVYADALKAFNDSNLQNAVVSLTEGVFAGKTAATVRQSFIQNAEKMNLKIRVAARAGKDGNGGYVVLSKQD